MSTRTMLPPVKEDGVLLSATAATATVLHRQSTMQRQLSSGGGGSSRRRSFFDDLQDQMQRHKQEDVEHELQKEVRNIHRILQRPADMRDANDIDMLYDWVLRNGSTAKIFQGAQEIICKTICREMTLLELPTNGIVCYQGDYGDVFFIIVAGSVSLYVETKKKLLPAQNIGNNSNATNPSNSLGDDARPQLHALSGLDGGSENGDFKPETYGSYIKQIGAGGTFGELAVMDPTARRSCTIICDVPTSFICLKRAAYQRLIRMTNSSQLDFTQVEFLETLYFFDHWPHSELMRVSNRLRHMTFPADSHLARIASEANLVFFIYAGVVQETIPLVHHLNGNGNVTKCTTLESDSALRITLQDLSLADRKKQPQRRRVALEVNLYQDHDICGEYPILFNKPTSNTDLLAVTDVKVLIMDRETWKEMFFMHGLDHVREAHRRFRQLAQARENWRQTRLKLELANPGLHITLSTKAMMQDGKCMCGWCGSSEHITGDLACPAIVASKQRQADKQRKKNADRSSPTGKKMKFASGGDGINSKAHTVKNTLTFVNQLQENASNRKGSALAMGMSVSDLHSGTITAAASRPTTPRTPSTHSRGAAPRHSTLKTVAQKIISDTLHQPPEKAVAGVSPSRPPSRPTRSGTPATPPTSAVPATHEPSLSASNASQVVVPPAAESSSKLRATSDLFEVFRAARGTAHAPGENQAEPVLAPAKVEDVRKGAFTEALSSQYRQELVRKAKRISKVEQFYKARGEVLETIQSEDARLPSERYNECTKTRKPKIPKPSRRLAMCSTNHEPRPDRFNRKINRMLKKMWARDHPVPVVEESLRDS